MAHLSESGALEVSVVSLNALIAEGRIPPASVLKINVEGAGNVVLRGAEHLLAEHRPLIFIELHYGERERCEPIFSRHRYELRSHQCGSR